MSLIFLSFYFSVLVMFSFVSHPVTYCVLLLLSALSVGGFSYCILGFTWYVLLFLLVYVGGVYVLFIFVSVHNPNPVSTVGSSFAGFIVSFFFFWGVLNSLGSGFPIFFEGSHYLCSYFEGFTYCLFCLILMVGFVSISIVVGSKDSFFR